MIRCNCGSETHVTETRSVFNVLRRRRVCDSVACGQRLTTIEMRMPDRVRITEHMLVLSQRAVANLRDTLESLLFVEAK